MTVIELQNQGEMKAQNPTQNLTNIIETLCLTR